MILAEQSSLVWFASSWVAVLIGMGLAIFGIAATFGGVVWVEHKSRVRKDVDLLLKQCRESENWDDKSELKLIQWTLDTPEERIYQCGLIKVRRIRASLNNYLYIHLYGRDPVPPPGWLESTLQNLADRLRYRRETRVQQKKKARGKVPGGWH
jgi:hypothetical protein